MGVRQPFTEETLRALAIPVIAIFLFDFGIMADFWREIATSEMPNYLVSLAGDLGKWALIGSLIEVFIGRRVFPDRAIGSLGPEDVVAWVFYSLSVPVFYWWKEIPLEANTVLPGVVMVAMLLLIHSLAHYVAQWTPDRPTNVWVSFKALSGIFFGTYVITYLAIVAIIIIQQPGL